ncbi:hypothetical protein HED22_19240 [Thalassospira sp. HF15]|uniref:flagellar hook-length control protein FliK n=1 Tax=Thalassospira sp. HF15 TaxID=2722755 RepID=UPI001430C35A|nr:flagellar hook-length control protein FliK [Thalassospira sp. HF15]NIY77794.1 hypothetical protein [Thalassospira sp. HF15]
MNSSAITNSVMPTVAVPGTNPSESKGSGFGDVMASITDKWSEHSHQVKYDAAKSAQNDIDERRAEMDARSSSRDERHIDEAHNDDRRDDEPVRASREDHEDHANIDDQKSDEPRDADANRPDDDGASDDTQHADSGNDDRGEGDTSDQANASSEESSKSTASADDTGTDADNTETIVTNPGMVDPNHPAQSVPLPGSPEAIELAKAKAAEVKANAAGGATTGQNAALANAQNGTTNPNGAAAADSTTDGLMNSTALSQPAAASSAKMAMNGADAGTGDELSSDKFLSRVVESMSGDGKGKSDAAGITNAAASGNGQTTNGAQQATANNPAQTAQAAQQAMAAAASAQNPQTNPAAQQGAATTSAVTATGGTEAAVTANGQPGTTNTLHQTNTGGQTAQTARQAPSQQVQQQVAVSIRNAASEGVDKISVQLRPEHLGRVDVKMEIGQDGRIQGVIQADTRETLDMLRQDSRALQQALKDAGLNADSQSFTFEHRNEGGQSQEGNGQSRMTAEQGSSPDEGDVMSGTELAEHVAIGYGINPNGLVDIRI